MDIENIPLQVYDGYSDEQCRRPSTPIISHVILAKFDILKGPSLIFQYPCDTGADQLHLAELMLPDGSHLRKEDWVLLVLNQRAAAKYRLSTLDIESITGKGIEGSIAWVQSYLYLECNKEWNPLGFDSKLQLLEFGIGTFIIWDCEVAHKLFEIDISQASFYIPEPGYVIIYNSHITLALIVTSEKEEGLLINYLLKNCNFENTYFLGRGYPAYLPTQADRKPLLYLLNLVQTKHMSGVDRGAQVNAIAIISRHRWISVFKPLLILALDEYLKNSDQEVLVDLYKSINSIDISYFPVLTTSEKYLLKFFNNKNLFRNKFDLIVKYISEHIERTKQNDIYRCLVKKLSREIKIDGTVSPSKDIETNIKAFMPSIKDGRYFNTMVLYSNVNVPIRIPLTLFPEEFPDFSVSKIIQTFGTSEVSYGTSKLPKSKNSGSFHYHPHLDSGINTAPLMIIINAILSGKRVVFLGDKRPAGEVAECVVSAGYIASGGGMIIPGINDRMFPYIGLSNLDYVFSVPGYIIGVTNTIFKEQTSWWDVLCNIVTGKVTVNRHLSSSVSLDSSVNNNISSDIQNQHSPSLPFFSTRARINISDDINENLQSGAAISNNYNFSFLPKSGSSSGRNSLNFCCESQHDIKKSYTSRFGLYLDESTLIPDILAGINDHVDEHTLRDRFEHYLKNFILAAAAYELNTYGDTNIALKTEHLVHPDWSGNLATLVEEISEKRIGSINSLKNRIEGWRATRNYDYYKKEYEWFLQNRAIKDVDIEHIIDILSEDAHKISVSNLVKLFMCLNDVLCVTSEDHVNEFLKIVCSRSRNLLPISYGLFHSRWEIRYSATKILQKIMSYQTGTEIINEFNPFIKIKLDHSIEFFDNIPVTSPALESIVVEEDPDLNYRDYNSSQLQNISSSNLASAPEKGPKSPLLLFRNRSASEITTSGPNRARDDEDELNNNSEDDSLIQAFMSPVQCLFNNSDYIDDEKYMSASSVKLGQDIDTDIDLNHQTTTSTEKESKNSSKLGPVPPRRIESLKKD